MKCNSCLAEWTPPKDRTITQCPFCNKPLFEPKKADNNASPHDVLVEIVHQFDKSILGETRLKGMLADYMPNTSQMYIRIFRQAVSDGVGSKLLSLVNESEAIRIVKIESIKESFKNNNAFNHTADYVVDCFLYALGWLEGVPEERENNETAIDAMGILVQQLNLAFSDNFLSKDESQSLFILGESMGMSEHEVLNVVMDKINALQLKPDSPVDSSLKSQKEIICSRNWLIAEKPKIPIPPPPPPPMRTAAFYDSRIKATRSNQVESLQTNANKGSQILKLSSNVVIKNEKDFINVLESNSNWWGDLFEDTDTYFALKAWIGSYFDIATRKVFDEMVHFYKPLGREYVKEAAIRFFKPATPILIGKDTFNIFTTNKLSEEVSALIAKVDEIWKSDPFKKVVFIIFQLEFSLRQLGNKTNPNNQQYLSVTQLIDKLLLAFKLKPGDFSDHKTDIQTVINKINENEAFVYLLVLIYGFNPERNFRDLKNNSINTIEDLGLLYIANEKYYSNNFLIAEKIHFLIRNEMKHLLELSYNDFLFEVFEKKKNALIELCDFELASDNHCKVGYDLSESLSNLIEKNNIKNVTIERKCKRNEITIKYGLFSNSKNLFHKNILQIQNEHKIADNAFNKNELEAFRQKFKKSCNRAFQLKNKITFISLSFIFGILSFYIIQNKLNSVFPVSEGVNLYGDYLNYLIFVALFTVIMYRIVIRKLPLKVRKSFSTLLSFGLFVFLAFNIWNAYAIHEKTKSYQHNFFLESFNPTLSETYKKLSANNIADIFEDKWPPKRTSSTSSSVFSSNLTHTRLRNGFRINAAIPILEGRFTDRGRSFLGHRIRWVKSFREVSGFPYAKYDITEIIPANENRIANNLYSVQLIASLLDNSSSTGLSIGDLDIVVSNNKIQLLNKADFPKHLKKNFSSRPFYYTLRYNLEGSSFTETREISNSKPQFDLYINRPARRNYLPFGISRLPRPVAQIHTQTIELNRQNDIDLIVNVDRNLVQVVLNNQLIMNYEYRLPEHSINLLSGLKSNILIKTINLNRITDNRLIEGKKPDQLKPTITAQGKPLSLMQSIGSQTVRTSDDDEHFEVLYKENGHYRIKSLSTNALYNVSAESVGKIKLL